MVCPFVRAKRPTFEIFVTLHLHISVQKKVGGLRIPPFHIFENSINDYLRNISIFYLSSRSKPHQSAIIQGSNLAETSIRLGIFKILINQLIVAVQ
jgi:hypothetical protein